MRSTILGILIALAASSAFAANETLTLLGARRVQDAVYFAPDGTALKVKVDGDKSFKPLDENTTYKAGARIDLAFENFNPLRYTVATSETFRDDETAKAVADFLQKVADTAGTVGGKPAQKAADVATTQQAAALATTRQLNLMDDTISALAMDKNACGNYEKLHRWLIQLRVLMRVPVVTKARFRTWVDRSTSAEGVKATRDDMKVALDELDANEKAITGVVEAIKKYFRTSLESKDLTLILSESDLASVLGDETARRAFLKKLSKNLQSTVKDVDDGEVAAKKLLDGALGEVTKLDTGNPEESGREQTCNEIRASTFAALLDISHDAAEIEEKKVALTASLTTLRTSLEKYTKGTSWRNTHDYIFLQPKPDPAKIDKIKVSIAERLEPKEQISVELTDKDAVTGEFDLRKYSAVITEVAAAMIYTDITYHEFGTDKNAAGQTIVKRVDDSHFPVEGALMLNLIPDWYGGNSFVFPALQFGVSSAKDSPGFLGGLALRFTGTKQFSISLGRMVTWHKTLNKLHEGDVVMGTADIAADLKLKRAPVAWYGGLQYSF